MRIQYPMNYRSPLEKFCDALMTAKAKAEHFEHWRSVLTIFCGTAAFMLALLAIYCLTP